MKSFDEIKNIKIIGGGFSGLSLAYYLLKNINQKGLSDKLSVEIIEKNARVGGLIDTVTSKYGFSETAASGFLNSVEVEEIFSELNLSFAKRNEKFSDKFIYRNGIKKWPLGIAATFKLFVVLGRIFLFRRNWQPRKKESIYTWGCRILTKESTENILLPALQGVYAGDPEKLSATLILSRFMKRKGTNKKLKIKGTVIPPGGMNEFIKTLTDKILSLGGTISYQADGEKVLEVKNEDSLYVLAVPAYEAAELMRKYDHNKASLLEKIDYYSLVSLTTFKKKDRKYQEGFGCLFPQSQKINSLGVLFNDGLYGDHAEFTKERWILGGYKSPEIHKKTEEGIVELVKEDHFKLYGEKLVTEDYQIKVWPKAIPHYNIYLEENVETFKTAGKDQASNIICFGNYLGSLGVGQILKAAKIKSLEIIEATG